MSQIRREDQFHLGIKALIHDNEGKILILQLHPKKRLISSEGWDLPGGRLQIGETEEETLKREVFEETGLKTIVQMTPLTMAKSHMRIPVGNGMTVGCIYSLYLCEVKVSPIILSDEHVFFDWYEPKVAAELLFAYPEEIQRKIAEFSLEKKEAILHA